jgi:alkylresorcinol/alkylpyrone synthase
VLLILDKTMKRLQPKPGEYGVLMAMGPAFSAELVLLQW